MNNCLVTEKHNFFGLTWENTYEKHNWRYFITDTKRRKCHKCNQKEILWGYIPGATILVEDWRRTND